jgi:hypothetical protein
MLAMRFGMVGSGFRSLGFELDEISRELGEYFQYLRDGGDDEEQPAAQASF